MQKFEQRWRIAVCAVLSAPSVALARPATQLPWEGPLDMLVRSLTGPVAFGISLISLFICGYALFAGGEISDFARRAIMAVMAISILVAGAPLLQTLFGVSAALI